ncbi:hypothetical protein CB1_000444001 [Camelus ferus]|nr:hypothetical protein CB1_000444001 [Camelus ferus]
MSSSAPLELLGQIAKQRPVAVENSNVFCPVSPRVISGCGRPLASMDFILPYNWFPSQLVPGTVIKSQQGSGLPPDIQKVSCLPQKILRATVACPHLLTAWMRRKSQKTQHLSSNENSTSKKKGTTVKEVKSQPQQTFEAGGEDVN